MAHNLFIEDGRASMMYVGTPPWHGLGTPLDRPATAAEAIRAANLDWQVKKVPLYAIDGPGVAPVPQRLAVVPEHRWRKADCPVFGLVGKDYTPLQNVDAFRFCDSIVGPNAAIYHTAGALGQGEKIWLLAKLPGEIRVTGEDISEKYLLLANGHDGKTAVQIKFTPVRVVCQNTLSLALESGKTLSVHHGRNFWTRLELTKLDLGLVQKGFEQLEVHFKQMASVQMDRQRLEQYLKAVFPDPPKDAGQRLRRIVLRDRSRSAELFETGTGNSLPKVKGTLWAALNGVTEYVDHHRGTYTAAERLQSIWFGRGYQIKTRAFDEACRYN